MNEKKKKSSLPLILFFAGAAAGSAGVAFANPFWLGAGVGLLVVDALVILMLTRKSQ